ncbi:MAG: hypothetical protein JWN56_1329 [Sphingobacteriales bacterium]|nr:hypothetical protein [Sphingobacteriales bacterium]
MMIKQLYNPIPDFIPGIKTLIPLKMQFVFKIPLGNERRMQ